MGIPVGNLAASILPCRAWLGSEEGIAGPGFSACRRRFEEKAERPASQLGERGDGSVGIEQKLARHRHNSRSCLKGARESGEFFESGVSHQEWNMGVTRLYLNCSGTSLT